MELKSIMKLDKTPAPFVFISHGEETTLIIPHDSHNRESWEEVKRLIQQAYINECILSNRKDRLRGSAEVVDMLERHPEFNCDFTQTERMLSWEMPGGD